MGNWIITLNCPYCGKWYSTILRLYHAGSGPAPLVHEINGETHILDVLDFKAESWTEIEISAEKREDRSKVILRGNLGGRFYQAEPEQE